VHIDRSLLKHIFGIRIASFSKISIRRLDYFVFHRYLYIAGLILWIRIASLLKYSFGIRYSVLDHYLYLYLIKFVNNFKHSGGFFGFLRK